MATKTEVVITETTYELWVEDFGYEDDSPHMGVSQFISYQSPGLRGGFGTPEEATANADDLIAKIVPLDNQDNRWKRLDDTELKDWQNTGTSCLSESSDRSCHPRIGKMTDLLKHAYAICYCRDKGGLCTGYHRVFAVIENAMELGRVPA